MNKDKEKSLKHAIGIELPQRRFGFMAIEKGFIKADQLYEALIKQSTRDWRCRGKAAGNDIEKSGVSFVFANQ